MVMHPDVQRRVHEEIATHIGSERLPTLDDRPLLKYFECVFLEVLRWIPGVPLGVRSFLPFHIVPALTVDQQVPHYVQEDCVLGKYSVPKGTIVLVNQWYDNFESMF